MCESQLKLHTTLRYNIGLRYLAREYYNVSIPGKGEERERDVAPGEDDIDSFSSGVKLLDAFLKIFFPLVEIYEIAATLAFPGPDCKWYVVETDGFGRAAF